MKATTMAVGRGLNPRYAGNFEGESDELRDLRLTLVAERDALKAENASLEEMNTQLREQNDAVGEACAKYEADLERIKQSWDEWIKKTEWVQETCQPKELGRHRADVLRMRIEALHAELERIKALEPVMVYHGVCTIDCGEHGHHDIEMLKMIPAGTNLYALGSKT